MTNSTPKPAAKAEKKRAEYPAIATMKVRHNGKSFDKDKPITGLTSEQRKALIEAGAARLP